MKIQIQIFMAMLIGINVAQIALFNPYVGNPYDNFLNQFNTQSTRRLNRYDVIPAADFSPRGFNTYNFNNYVPLHYGLFSENEVKNVIRSSINRYQRDAPDPADLQAGADYREDFFDENPITAQDWYGISSFSPRSYNSYRVF